MRPASGSFLENRKENNMDIPLNVEVKCSDGAKGRSVCLVVDPIHKEITHVVVETRGVLGLQHMVPLDEIASSTAHQIQLRCTGAELEAMDSFIRSRFIEPGDANYAYYLPMELERGAGDSFFWPYTPYTDYSADISDERIPTDELGIHRGSHVEATDGRIGRIDEFLVNPTSNRITHLVLREGHLWGQKHVTIPVSEIKRLGDDVVYLKLTRKEVQELPATPVERGR